MMYLILCVSISVQVCFCRPVEILQVYVCFQTLEDASYDIS